MTDLIRTYHPGIDARDFERCLWRALERQGYRRCDEGVLPAGGSIPRAPEGREIVVWWETRDGISTQHSVGAAGRLDLDLLRALSAETTGLAVAMESYGNVGRACFASLYCGHVLELYASDPSSGAPELRVGGAALPADVDRETAVLGEFLRLRDLVGDPREFGLRLGEGPLRAWTVERAAAPLSRYQLDGAAQLVRAALILNVEPARFEATFARAGAAAWRWKHHRTPIAGLDWFVVDASAAGSLDELRPLLESHNDYAMAVELRAGEPPRCLWREPDTPALAGEGDLLAQLDALAVTVGEKPGFLRVLV